MNSTVATTLQTDLIGGQLEKKALAIACASWCSLFWLLQSLRNHLPFNVLPTVGGECVQRPLPYFFGVLQAPCVAGAAEPRSRLGEYWARAWMRSPRHCDGSLLISSYGAKTMGWI